jgi:outer membrane protein OmpA-like peptidoglycan-associated protein
MRRSLLFCCLLLLTACESPLQKLQALNPQPEDFRGSLASEYLSYAQSESEQGRKLIAERYGDKGLKAALGQTVEPNPVDTSLPADDQLALTKARAQLMTLMTPEMKQEAPQQLARAQLLFDCWQHEIKRRINQELAPCEDEFQTTLSELQGMAFNEETEHTLAFAKNSTHLSTENRDMLREVAKEVAHRSHYVIEIAAADTMGTKERKLANARLSTVHSALIKIGVAEKYIRVKKEADNKKVYLSCDVSPENKGTVTVTVKTLEAQEGAKS